MKLRILLAVTALALCMASAGLHSWFQTSSGKARNAAGTLLSTADTTVDADTSYIELKDVSQPWDLMVTLTNTKVSGTVAGTAYFEGSDDNVTWYGLNSTTTGIADGQIVDTADLGNATEVNTWVYAGCTIKKFHSYRLRLVYSTGSSTPTARFDFYNPNFK